MMISQVGRVLLAGTLAVAAGPALAQTTEAPAAPLETQQAPAADAPAAADAPMADAPATAEAPAAAGSPATAEAPAGIDEQGVRRIQEALNQAGHDAGAVDGIWGPQTQGALNAFQQAQGIAPGDTARTLEALGLQDFAAPAGGAPGIDEGDLADEGGPLETDPQQ